MIINKYLNLFEYSIFNIQYSNIFKKSYSYSNNLNNSNNYLNMNNFLTKLIIVDDIQGPA